MMVPIIVGQDLTGTVIDMEKYSMGNLRKTLRYMVLILLMALTSTCKSMGTPSGITTEPPPGPPEYQQGYRDGCESGFASYGTPFHKVFNKFKQDPYLAQDPVYYQAWSDAFNYCRGAIMAVMSHGWGNRSHPY